jgi:hypothetical protein
MMAMFSCQYLELSGPNASMEIEAEFSFTFIKGYPAHYGSLSYAGHPDEPDRIEDIEVVAIYQMTKNARGEYACRSQLELTQWLADFCNQAVCVEDLLSEALNDA